MALIEDAPGTPEDAVDCLLASGATHGSCTFPITVPPAIDLQGGAPGGARRRRHLCPHLQWLCANNACPGVVGTLITYRDRHHLSATYAGVLAKPLAQKLASVIS